MVTMYELCTNLNGNSANLNGNSCSQPKWQIVNPTNLNGHPVVFVCPRSFCPGASSEIRSFPSRLLLCPCRSAWHSSLAYPQEHLRVTCTSTGPVWDWYLLYFLIRVVSSYNSLGYHPLWLSDQPKMVTYCPVSGSRRLALWKPVYHIFHRT